MIPYLAIVATRRPGLEPGPITTDVSRERDSGSSLGLHRHRWLWVPAQGRDDVDGVRFKGHRHSIAIPRREAPEVLRFVSPKENRGRRESRVRAAPAVSCANVYKKTHTSIQVQRRQSGLPCAMVLRLMPRSPRRRIRSCHRHRRIKVCQSPVGPTHLRQFSTSNGCQDHTVLPYALAPFVCALLIAHRQSPPCDSSCAPDAAASTASHPASVTIAIRPSGGRDGDG
jgi:hypothetical protein